MVKLKLNLKLKHSRTIRSSNGKTYRLQPGSNVLNLEYEDYVALAKTLGIKPVEKPLREPAAKKYAEDKKEKVSDENKEEPAVDPVKDKEKSVVESVEDKKEETATESVEESKEVDSEPVVEDKKESVEQAVEEKKDNLSDVKEEVNEPESSTNEADSNTDSEVVDYNSWSYADLKAKYKEITGATCKLKKVEIIAFLQEHNSNV